MVMGREAGAPRQCLRSSKLCSPLLVIDFCLLTGRNTITHFNYYPAWSHTYSSLILTTAYTKNHLMLPLLLEVFLFSLLPVPAHLMMPGILQPLPRIPALQPVIARH